MIILCLGITRTFVGVVIKDLQEDLSHLSCFIQYLTIYWNHLLSMSMSGVLVWHHKSCTNPNLLLLQVILYRYIHLPLYLCFILLLTASILCNDSLTQPHIQGLHVHVSSEIAFHPEISDVNFFLAHLF